MQIGAGKGSFLERSEFVTVDRRQRRSFVHQVQRSLVPRHTQRGMGRDLLRPFQCSVERIGRPAVYQTDGFGLGRVDRTSRQEQLTRRTLPNQGGETRNVRRAQDDTKLDGGNPENCVVPNHAKIACHRQLRPCTQRRTMHRRDHRCRKSDNLRNQ